MNSYTIWRESESAPGEQTEVAEYDDEKKASDFLRTVQPDELWLHKVTTWFTGHAGDWPEDCWEIEYQERADEWLDKYSH